MAETILYLASNAFRMYLFIRFFGLFLERRRSKRWIFGSCGVYFVINSAGYLFINFDRLTLAINIIGLLIIAIAGYRGSIVKKVIAVFAYLGVAVLIEDIAWVLFLKEREGRAIGSVFFWVIFVLFLLETAIEKTVRLRKEGNVSPYKGVMLIGISVGSILLSMIIVEAAYRNPILPVMASCLLLAMDVAVFYFYEKLLDDYEKQKNEEMYRLQLSMYRKQLKLMQNANDAYKSMRHDMKQHLAMVTGYIQKDENEKALEYIAKMGGYAGQGNQYVRTGNEGIDSIFNYFVEEVNRSGGSIVTDMKIPEGLSVDDFDMNVILSNLLLNACEAIRECSRKEIRAVMKFDRGILKIHIENTYHGVVRQTEEGYLSTKKEKGEHGIGLASVRRTVEKYGGEMKVSHTEDWFKVDILMCI